jgi:hypothetical protein
MTSRYGRNQKRRHRAESAFLNASLEELTKQNQRTASMLSFERMAHQQARESALIEYAKRHGLIDEAIKYIRRELARSFAGAMQKPVDQIMSAIEARRRGPLMELSVHSNSWRSGKIEVLEGTIPEQHYRIELFSPDRRSP